MTLKSLRHSKDSFLFLCLICSNVKVDCLNVIIQSSLPIATGWIRQRSRGFLTRLDNVRWMKSGFPCLQWWWFFLALHHENLVEFLNITTCPPHTYVGLPMTMTPNSFLFWCLISRNLSTLPLSIPICLWFLLQINRFWPSFTCFSVLNRETFGVADALPLQQWKCCNQCASKFGKLSSGHRTGKGQFSFQSQRKAIPKNAQTTTQLHSSHMLGK